MPRSCPDAPLIAVVPKPPPHLDIPTALWVRCTRLQQSIAARPRVGVRRERLVIGAKRNRKVGHPLFAVMAALVLAVALAACEGAGDDDEGADSDEPVVVGASLPLTGPLSVP